jgi:hypothetical protein
MYTLKSALHNDNLRKDPQDAEATFTTISRSLVLISDSQSYGTNGSDLSNVEDSEADQNPYLFDRGTKMMLACGYWIAGSVHILMYTIKIEQV